jgi:uncharacterized membrane protein (DUF485 family)
MSQKTLQEKIRANPKFAELVGKRTRFAIILSLVVLVPYYSFMAAGFNAAADICGQDQLKAASSPSAGRLPR